MNDDAPLYDPHDLPAELLRVLADLPLHTLHYGLAGAVCGAQVPAGQVTDITALVSCQPCLMMDQRGHLNRNLRFCITLYLANSYLTA